MEPHSPYWPTHLSGSPPWNTHKQLHPSRRETVCELRLLHEDDCNDIESVLYQWACVSSVFLLVVVSVLLWAAVLVLDGRVVYNRISCAKSKWQFPGPLRMRNPPSGEIHTPSRNTCTTSAAGENTRHMRCVCWKTLANTPVELNKSSPEDLTLTPL